MLPLTDKQAAAAAECVENLRADGFRVTLDARSEKVGAKIRALRVRVAEGGSATDVALAAGATYGAHLVPGQHLGTAAQPKRHKPGKR